MCKTYRIGTYVDVLILRVLFQEYNLVAHVECEEESSYLWQRDDGFRVVEITGISDKCLCNLTTKEQKTIIEFIDRVSII